MTALKSNSWQRLGQQALVENGAGNPIVAATFSDVAQAVISCPPRGAVMSRSQRAGWSGLMLRRPNSCLCASPSCRQARQRRQHRQGLWSITWGSLTHQGRFAELSWGSSRRYWQVASKRGDSLSGRLLVFQVTRFASYSPNTGSSRIVVELDKSREFRRKQPTAMTVHVPVLLHCNMKANFIFERHNLTKRIVWKRWTFKVHASQKWVED